MMLMREFGVEPNAEPVRETVALVQANCRWEHAGQPFFAGEVEPCINGRTVAIGAYFGVAVDDIVSRLLGEQLADGGWNCEAENGSLRSSFHSTICVLEGLLAFERATGGSTRRRRGAPARRGVPAHRRLFRRRSTGAIVDADWLQFSFPTTGTTTCCARLITSATGDPPDPALTETVDLLRSKRRPDGTWSLENTHRGAVHFPLENGDGTPSRWNTLRALRVLAWYDGNR